MRKMRSEYHSSTSRLLSLLTFLIFVVLTNSCKVVGEFNSESFDSNRYPENIEDMRPYVEMNDGSKVFGKGISIKNSDVTIEDKKFKNSEIRGFFNGTNYYATHKAQFIKRIVRGKINVYLETHPQKRTKDGITHVAYTVVMYFAQKGDDGKMEYIGTRDDISRLVADCPLA